MAGRDRSSDPLGPSLASWIPVLGANLETGHRHEGDDTAGEVLVIALAFHGTAVAGDIDLFDQDSVVVPPRVLSHRFPRNGLSRLVPQSFVW